MIHSEFGKQRKEVEVNCSEIAPEEESTIRSGLHKLVMNTEAKSPLT